VAAQPAAGAAAACRRGRHSSAHSMRAAPSARPAVSRCEGLADWIRLLEISTSLCV
jgi:hypothetical protein